MRHDPTLKMAWERFALFDANSVRYQTNFKRLRTWILGLGVLSTVLALILTTLYSTKANPKGETYAYSSLYQLLFS